MRLKLTSFLVLINIALFAYLVLLERETVPGADESKAVIAPGVLAQAEEIRVSGPTMDHPWSARREGEGWAVQTPVQWPANPYAMQRILDLLRMLRWETKFSLKEVHESGRSLGDYGLGENSAMLTLVTPAREVTVRLGSPTEVGSRLYLLSPDEEEIYVVQRSLLEGVDLSSGSLIDPAVLHIPPFETRSIYLQVGDNGSVKVEIAREGDSWVLRAPIRVAASTDAVNAALENLYQLQIEEFVSDPRGGFGLSTPYIRINLNGNNRQQTLIIGDIVDPGAMERRRYAKLEARSVIFTVPAEPFEVWRTAQESLRERQIMAFPPEQASALRIRSATESLDLHRLESGRWQLVSTGDDESLRTVTADDAVIGALLEQLASLEVAQFVSDAPSNVDLERFGFKDPQRTITVRLRNDRSLTVLLGDFVIEELGDQRTTRIYAKRDNSPSIYLTPASILAAVPLNELHYRERIAGSLPSGAFIERLTIRDLEADSLLIDARRDPQEHWTVSDGTLEADARSAVLALAEAIRRFPVRQFVTRDFSDPLVLDRETTIPWTFAVEAHVRLAGANANQIETRRYLLTERLGGMTQFGASPTLDLVFTLPINLVDALHPVLFRRPRPDAEINPAPAESAPPVPFEAPPARKLPDSDTGADEPESGGEEHTPATSDEGVSEAGNG